MIGVACDDHAPSRYVEEILSRAGMPWRRLDPRAMAPLPHDIQVVVLVGDGRLDRLTRDVMTQFVRTGGAVVATGGTWGLDDLLGATLASERQDGFVVSEDASHPITAGLAHPLHVFVSPALHTTIGIALGRLMAADAATAHGASIVTNRVGQGVTVAIAPNIPASVLRIQLGREIHEDGEPAPDGTAPIDEGILKTDDGVVLSWQHDRTRTPPAAPVPDCPGKDAGFPAGDTPWFAWPVADELRALLFRAIAWAATATGHTLPFLWPWPHQLPAVGLISHDSDHNIDAAAHTALRLLAQAGITSTWCHMYGPTYPNRYERETFAAIQRAGHELALHYNALPQDGGAWGQEHLAGQAAFVRAESGAARFISNKNHFLRWEGGVEFFHWLAEEGIQADQSKGPSKKGNVGYPHGSGLPWFPLDPATGETIDVVEIPLQFQDLWLTAPPYLAETTIAQARAHQGVAHFLFHQFHLHTKPEVAETMLATIALGRAQGLEWWTSARINDWERQRRQVKIAVATGSAESTRLVITTPQPVAGAAIGLVLPPERPAPTVALSSDREMTRALGQHAGLPTLLLQLDLPAGETVLQVVP